MLTLEEFEDMDNLGYELVDGRLVEKGMGALASKIGTRIGSRISLHCEANKLGDVYVSECGFRLFPSRHRHVRKPDVAFVARERMPNGTTPLGWHNLRPDLAVEVNSPHDLLEEFKLKLKDYLEAGIPLIWIVSPEIKTIDVYRIGVPMETIGIDGILTGEPVLPGFTLKVAELFAE